jgi:hypothetical protein
MAATAGQSFSKGPNEKIKKIILSHEKLET